MLFKPSLLKPEINRNSADAVTIALLRRNISRYQRLSSGGPFPRTPAIELEFISIVPSHFILSLVLFVCCLVYTKLYIARHASPTYCMSTAVSLEGL